MTASVRPIQSFSTSKLKPPGRRTPDTRVEDVCGERVSNGTGSGSAARVGGLGIPVRPATTIGRSGGGWTGGWGHRRRTMTRNDHGDGRWRTAGLRHAVDPSIPNRPPHRPTDLGDPGGCLPRRLRPGPGLPGHRHAARRAPAAGQPRWTEPGRVCAARGQSRWRPAPPCSWPGRTVWRSVASVQRRYAGRSRSCASWARCLTTC